MAALEGKHIVITGASSGIGAELARQLATRRVRLTIAARRLERLEELAAELRKTGSEVLCLRCDVTRREEIDALAAAAREGFGEIDVWVSNAGRGMRHRVLQAGEDDLIELYRLNCISSLYAYQAVIPQWRARSDGGSGRQIVDICSLGGKCGYAFNGGYAAAKHAMSGLADTLRLELNGSGIYVTTVYPGRTVSDFSDAVVDRTGGDESTRTLRIAKRGSFLARKIAGAQSAEAVVRAIVRAIERPRSRVFPHTWGSLAVWVYNFFPELALMLSEKLGREQEGKGSRDQADKP